MEVAMITKVALSSVLVALAGALPGSTATAQEASPSASVRIVDRPAILRADGGVRLAVAAKCDATLQAFELDASLTQYQASGFLLRLAPPAVVVCDGSRHRNKVIVYPSSGSFVTGTAKASVFVGFYDPQQDRDLARQDAATITIVTKGE